MVLLRSTISHSSKLRNSQVLWLKLEAALSVAEPKRLNLTLAASETVLQFPPLRENVPPPIRTRISSGVSLGPFANGVYLEKAEGGRENDNSHIFNTCNTIMSDGREHLKHGVRVDMGREDRRTANEGDSSPPSQQQPIHRKPHSTPGRDLSTHYFHCKVWLFFKKKSQRSHTCSAEAGILRRQTETDSELRDFTIHYNYERVISHSALLWSWIIRSSLLMIGWEWKICCGAKNWPGWPSGLLQFSSLTAIANKCL